MEPSVSTNVKDSFVILLVVCCFTACNDVDETDIDNELHGSWSLVNASCGDAPIELQVGDQMWTFNLKQKELVVKGNLTQQCFRSINSGVYDIDYSSNKVKILSVFWDYWIENGQLYLWYRHEVDGPLLVFVRY